MYYYFEEVYGTVCVTWYEEQRQRQLPLTLVCLVSSLCPATPTCNAINQLDKFNYPAVCDKAGRASSLLSNFTYLASPLSFPLLPSTRNRRHNIESMNHVK